MTTQTAVDPPLQAVRASAGRLRSLVTPLSPTQLEGRAYPTEWTIADVVSHLGSGAVIMQRRIDDNVADQQMPDDFAQSVWDTWNAKSPSAKAHDGLAADQALIERIDTMSDDERSRFRMTLGPMEFDLAGFIGLRLNEHALHTWDIAVVADPAATLPLDAAELIVDNLELIARFTAKPTGSERTIIVHTSAPNRQFTIVLTPDAVRFATDDDGRRPDLELPAEAFSRLVYGRLDDAHTPAFTGDGAALDELRQVFPGP